MLRMNIDVLVLGATGITGRRIAARLAARGASVRAASRNTADGHTSFDWANVSTHHPALAGATALYLVPPPLVVDPSAALAALLETARLAGVRTVVACSSLGVTFPHEPAHSGRLAWERAGTNSGLAWTVLRPGGFMQNFSEGFLLQGILRAGGVTSATGDGAVALIDADDIADVAVDALVDDRHAGQHYSLTGPSALTFARATELVAAAAGKPLTHRSISSTAFASMLQSVGLPATYVEVLVRDQEAIRDGHAVAVSDDVERVLGRRPGTFEAFAMRAANAWRR